MTTILLNFRAEFAPLVESGEKPHTVRARRRDGRDPLPGDTLHLYTGLRTKAVRLMRREVCDYVREITIQPSAGNVHHVLLGGIPLEQSHVEMLARFDGFTSGTEFVSYFEKTYGLPFTGLLIGWDATPAYVTRH
jgi:hypothetical protein